MSTPQFPKMPWFPRDFRSSTLGWPLAARGVYRELLDAQWDQGGSTGPGTLPADPEALRAIAMAAPTEWKIAWPYIESKFPLADGGRRNERLETHRQACVREYRSRQKGAHTTNTVRWGKNGRSANAQ